ncbi:MAG: glycosyltransferase family 8 protein [Clostridia bacterium]|nr:glycosyltransferase family 8 protein [Clostridia bacterium]
MNTLKNQSKNTIPIFFASDANYLPFLTVTLYSLKENASKNYNYKIYVLHAGINETSKQDVLSFNDQNFSIEFVDVSANLESVKNSLQLRDYYTGATYYRIFIANMFPKYDKAIYLDCDTIVLGDISKLYAYSLNDEIVGGVTDGIVSSNEVFKEYCSEVLGVDAKNYFNAGVILINLKKFREENYFEKFCALLKEYKFSVAQDQDYLNVLCKDKVKYLPYSWNVMPVGKEGSKKPNLIHYNLTLKPWHYADIPYAKEFWQYAKLTKFYNQILSILNSYTDKEKERDKQAEIGLIKLAQSEIDREDNFIKVRRKAQENYSEALKTKAEDFFKNDSKILSVTKV